ncbi:putative arabinose efflux permease, MFS family [Streptoalloteichus tenebrarius]|uniref:Multidrug efflux pump Tap n=1 Tax=Streptoalloteichus tenebrarius (strain ATCC 17920 / DSM 40477 / JCM 4838 / CBS 697.72 / NBRC 16177 / NCIMB 11028 / NRRL B-12390 / A12253. 1 / ISP 5477) TaxID=1933 RepID=A0ABT1HU44_STRSD|nr:MFS transporter [Streptoalloteichus tenebrarius]MCP2259051.1 putative arabinose efflux permease, MFS family [Streptoalloteichus tenebrarius]BFE99623.1 MFS transporter [Streptoalloteichus tenebrarius]
MPTVPGVRVDRAEPTGRWAPLLLLESSTLLTGTANGIITLTVPWLVLDRTGSAAAAGLVAAATTAPMILAVLFAGTAVDMLGRRRAATVCELLSAVAVLGMTAVDAWLGPDVLWLVVLSVLRASLVQVGVTAREAMLPAVAGRLGWGLERINGLHQGVWGLTMLAGPGLAGVVVGAFGAAATLPVVAAAYLVSAVTAALIRVPRAGAPTLDERPRGLWRATREGLVFVWRDRLLRAIVLLSFPIFAAYLPIEGVVLPAHFQARGEPERLGALVLAMSAGGILGTLGYGALAHRFRRRTAFVAACVASGVTVLGMAFLPSYSVLVALGAVSGLVYGPINPLLHLAMQTRTPERLRGRVLGVVNAVAYSAGPLGFLAVGPLVESFGVGPVFLGLAVALLLVTTAAVAVRPLAELDAPHAATPAESPDGTPEPPDGTAEPPDGTAEPPDGTAGAASQDMAPTASGKDG